MASPGYHQINNALLTQNLFAIVRDQIDERHKQQQERDAAFEAYFHSWKQQGLLDDTVITEVLKNIYGDHQDCHTFDHALFAWFYYGDNREAGDTLRGLLEKYTRQVVRKQWEPPFKTV